MKNEELSSESIIKKFIKSKKQVSNELIALVEKESENNELLDITFRALD